MKDRRAPRAMVFTRGGVRFSVSADRMRAVEPYPDPARVPNTPAEIVGLIAWRGAVLPMIEPGAAAQETATAVVVASSDGGDLAFAADEIAGWDDADGANAIDPDQVYHRLRDTVRRVVREPDGQESVDGPHER